MVVLRLRFIIKNKPTAAMSEDGSQPKVRFLLAGGRKSDVMEMCCQSVEGEAVKELFHSSSPTYETH